MNFSLQRQMFQRKHPLQLLCTTPVSFPHMCQAGWEWCDCQTRHSALLEQHWTGRHPVNKRKYIAVCVHVYVWQQDSIRHWVHWGKKLRAHNPCHTDCSIHTLKGWKKHHTVFSSINNQPHYSTIVVNKITVPYNINSEYFSISL